MFLVAEYQIKLTRGGNDTTTLPSSKQMNSTSNKDMWEEVLQSDPWEGDPWEDSYSPLFLKQMREGGVENKQLKAYVLWRREVCLVFMSLQLLLNIIEPDQVHQHEFIRLGKTTVDHIFGPFCGWTFNKQRPKAKALKLVARRLIGCPINGASVISQRLRFLVKNEVILPKVNIPAKELPYNDVDKIFYLYNTNIRQASSNPSHDKLTFDLTGTVKEFKTWTQDSAYNRIIISDRHYLQESRKKKYGCMVGRAFVIDTKRITKYFIRNIQKTINQHLEKGLTPGILILNDNVPKEACADIGLIGQHRAVDFGHLEPMSNESKLLEGFHPPSHPRFRQIKQCVDWAFKEGGCDIILQDKGEVNELIQDLNQYLDSKSTSSDDSSSSSPM